MSADHTNGLPAPELAAERLRRLAEHGAVAEAVIAAQPPEERREPAAPDAPGERVRRLQGERGDELARGVGELADPVAVRSHAPRVGGALLNVDEDRLFGDGGAITRVYGGHEAVRSNAWRLMHLRRLGEVLGRVVAAKPDMDRERAVGEAARARTVRLAETIALVRQDVAEHRDEVAAAEQAIEDAIGDRAAIRDAGETPPDPVGPPAEDDPTAVPAPMPGDPLERVEIALAGKAKLVFLVELLMLTLVLGTLLADVIPSRWPFAIDVHLACAGVAAGMLATGAVFGWGLAGTGLSRRVAAAVFAVAALAVVLFGVRKLEAAYGATVPEQAQEVFVIGSFGAILLAAFVSYVDVVYRAHERVRTAVERGDDGAAGSDRPHGTPLTDADERVERMYRRHAERLALLQRSEQRLAELEGEHDRLLVVDEESESRALSRQAELARDQVTAAAVEAECGAGVRQEIGHRDASIHGALLGRLKAFHDGPAKAPGTADPAVPGIDASAEAAAAGAGPDPGRSRRRALQAGAAGALLAAGVVAALTQLVWVLVGGAALAAGLLLLRRRDTGPRRTPPQRSSGGGDVREIGDGEMAPAAGVRRWHWHPSRLVPGYERGYDADARRDQESR